MLEAPIQDNSPETGGYGLLGCSILLCRQDRLGRSFSVRVVEAAGRVAVLVAMPPGYSWAPTLPSGLW